ncbi:hypothetical protein [Streptomyces sp. NBC_01190]|uniref:hypothetical protein n=1 Tax=Streptomyces sp. NBC_01190 TaxID=2903767 RepID=UPI00386EFE0E|nr:hypothetical protein OG519_06935 [Streptomyces sp. NBC_01190]
MTMDRVDRLTRTVREQLALGRLIPLGGPADTAWITESAAVESLRRTAAGLHGVRLREVEVLVVEWDTAELPAAAPVGALPHLPVRVEAAFEAAADQPLPLTAQRLRDVLWGRAQEGLGLMVAAVDLRITGLLDEDPPALPAGSAGGSPDQMAAGVAAGVVEGVVVPAPEGAPPGSPAARPGGREALEAAALAVPGVQCLTHRLTGLGSGVRVRDVPQGDPTARHVQVQIAVAPGQVALRVARAVAEAVTAAAAPAAPGPVTTVVVVTDVG